MGFFLIMIVFMIVAIVRAKNGNPWIWYAIGVVLQLLSLSGLQRQYSAFGMGSALSGVWGVFFVIAIITLFIILARKNKE